MQLDALRAAGVSRIFEETASSVGARPELERCLSSLCEGDVFVVYKLDRVARSLMDLLSILDRIKACGAKIRSLNEPLDTTTPIGVFVVQVLGSVAQLERSIIRERAIAGQVAAWRRGVRWGGTPRVVSDEDARELVRLRETGLFTIPMLADVFGCSESTVWRTIWLATKPGAGKLRRRGAPVLSRYL